MSEEQGPTNEVESWPILGEMEKRILGALVEKAKTTADSYPMTVNSLVSACNQKSNRDPVMSVSEEDVEDTLLELQKQKLVKKVDGSRVDRWRHGLYEAWDVGKVELAILAELLLRGAQTKGELRSRVSRMEPIDDLESLNEHLAPMVERGLIHYLTDEDKRGATLTHGFISEEELSSLKENASAGGGGSRSSSRSEMEQRIAKLEAEVVELREELNALKERGLSGEE